MMTLPKTAWGTNMLCAKPLPQPLTCSVFKYRGNELFLPVINNLRYPETDFQHFLGTCLAVPTYMFYKLFQQVNILINAQM